MRFMSLWYERARLTVVEDTCCFVVVASSVTSCHSLFDEVGTHVKEDVRLTLMWFCQQQSRKLIFHGAGSVCLVARGMCCEFPILEQSQPNLLKCNYCMILSYC